MDPFEAIEEDEHLSYHENETVHVILPKIEFYLSYMTRYVSIVFLLLIILISLSKRLRECYKWFIFHTAILNIIFIVLLEVLRYLPTNFIAQYQLQYIVFFIGNLSVNSMVLLSFNRFIFLYFKQFHEKLFNRENILLIILSYDLFIAAILNFVHFVSDQSTLEYTVIAIVLVCYIIFPVLILVKIRKMSILLSPNNVQRLTLYDLKKAAIVCAFQTFIFLFFLVSAFLQEYLLYLLTNDMGSMLAMDLYLILSTFHFVLFELFIIADACLMLFILKAYRIILKKYCKNFFLHVFKKEESTHPTRTWTIGVPNGSSRS